MRVQKNFLLILSLLLLSSCSWIREPEKEIVTVTEIVKPQIGIAERPKGLSMQKVNWYVVTKENYEEFSQKFEKTEGDLVFYAGDNRAVGGITTILKHTCEVHWSDGEHTYTYKYNLEVQ